MPTETIQSRGNLAGIQLSLLRTLGWALKPFNLRGFGKTTYAIARAFPAANSATIRNNGASFTFPLSDGYWSQLLTGARYEPEIGWLMSRIAPGTAFIDCGANYGYWSTRAVHSPKIGHVVAIEASPATFRWLARNAADNGFEARQVAIWSEPDETKVLSTTPGRHAGASLLGTGTERYEVRTETLDAIALSMGVLHSPVLVKLDVEGSEVPALEGASQLISGGRAIFVYEEHGADPTCATTRAIVDDFGLDVALLTETGPRPIRSVAEACGLKSDKRKGYNFLASPPGALVTVN